MKIKSQEQLIAEGKPFIRYSKEDSMYSQTQVFLTEEACETRIAELKKQGYAVARFVVYEFDEKWCVYKYKGCNTVNFIWAFKTLKEVMQHINNMRVSE